jgi:hypothetical protein
MTHSEARKILKATIATNESGCAEEIQCVFSRSIHGRTFCNVYVFSGDHKGIIETFDTFDFSPLEITKQILKYRKAGGKNGNDVVSDE